jgi:hypothetical protein
LLLAFLGTLLGLQARAQTASAPPKPRQWFAQFAFFAPDDSHLLVTQCKYAKRQTLMGCRPWRYHLADKRWEEIMLSPDDPDWSVDSATYSPDGKTIAATIVKCVPNGLEKIFPKCPYLDYRLLLIDAATGKHRTIASDNARFQPSFTPDGKGLVYWQLDNLQGVATGTTPYPAKQAQTLYATHNLHTLSLSDERGRMAIKVRAQRPLAPPRVFPDGIRVTVAGSAIFGAVTTEEGVYKGIWSYQNGQEIDDSLLIGNLQTGVMYASLPRGFPEKVIFDARKLPNEDAEQVIYSEKKIYVTTSNLKPLYTINRSPTFKVNHDSKSISHASFSSRDDTIVYIVADGLMLSSLNRDPKSEVIERPIISAIINSSK